MVNIYVFLIRLGVIMVSAYLVTAFAFCSLNVGEWGIVGRVTALLIVVASMFLVYKKVGNE